MPLKAFTIFNSDTDNLVIGLCYLVFFLPGSTMQRGIAAV